MDMLTFGQASEQVWFQVMQSDTVATSGRIIALIHNYLNMVRSQIFASGSYPFNTVLGQSISTTAAQGYISLPRDFDAEASPRLYAADGSKVIHVVPDLDTWNTLTVNVADTTGEPVYGFVSTLPSSAVFGTKGAWANATGYVVNDHVASGTAEYVCAVAHTSTVGPQTFAQEVVAHPTYWRLVVSNRFVLKLLPEPTAVQAYRMDYKQCALTLTADSETPGMTAEWMPVWVNGGCYWTEFALRGRETANRWGAMVPEFVRVAKEPPQQSYTGSFRPPAANTALWRRVARGTANVMRR